MVGSPPQLIGLGMGDVEPAAAISDLPHIIDRSCNQFRNAQARIKGQFAENWLDRMECQRRICDDLTKQVFERAQVLVAAGASPADEATVARDWRARATGVHLAEWPAVDGPDPSSTVN